MSQLNEKTTCIFYKSLFEAAERFYEKDPETALEIYHSFFKYAFCRTENVDTDNEIAELLVKQNIESFKAADNRFAAAVKNGDKGKEYGELGKEYGKLGGRPRKGETREEYWERKRKECSKNPPENPPLSGDKETPLTTATASSTTTAKTTSSTTSKSSTTSVGDDPEYYLREFLCIPSKDFSSLLTNERFFVESNSSDLTILKDNLLNKCNCHLSNRQIIDTLKFMYKEKINFKTSN